VREIVHLRKFRDASTKAAASELKNLNPDRDLSDNEYALLVNKMDQVFKVARPKPQSTSAAERPPASAHLSSSPPPAPSTASDGKRDEGGDVDPADSQAA